jgi:type II secretory pathway predicted ATPase ExeA
MLVPIIDDAHLMPSDCLRKLRLLCEDFPRTHNLVLIGQPPFLRALALSVNEEIRSRVTYSAILPRLSPEVAEPFILDQLDQAGLGHNTFTHRRPGPYRPFRRGPAAPHPQSLPQFT